MSNHVGVVDATTNKGKSIYCTLPSPIQVVLPSSDERANPAYVFLMHTIGKKDVGWLSVAHVRKDMATITPY